MPFNYALYLATTISHQWLDFSFLQIESYISLYFHFRKLMLPINQIIYSHSLSASLSVYVPLLLFLSFSLHKTNKSVLQFVCIQYALSLSPVAYSFQPLSYFYLSAPTFLPPIVPNIFFSHFHICKTHTHR